LAKVGLIVDENKIICMKCSRKQSSENKIKLGNAEIESVSTFKYIGAVR
jgi:hypothetical protein